MVPGAVCWAKVGLEMVKHNEDSVRPEGLKQRRSARAPQGSPRLLSPSAVREIGVKNVDPNFLKCFFTLLNIFIKLSH